MMSSSLQVLICVLLYAVKTATSEFVLIKYPFQGPFCGRLKCEKTVDSNPGGKLTSATIYAVSYAGNHKLLSMSSDNPDIVVNEDNMGSFFLSRGTMTANHLDLRVYIRNQLFCDRGEFKCVLLYLQDGGHEIIFTEKAIEAPATQSEHTLDEVMKEIQGRSVGVQDVPENEALRH